ncbi:MAG TPA: hybrid sensor histidine kinase/response regulator [Candidatus Didemnitutus sp.]|nr:hybrid sensor histidine kinase/response regulator [Candidatus Didemnitutus sp.]
MSPRDFSEKPGDILVVDDTPANLQLLVGMLKEQGWKVRPVPSGEMALRAVNASPPDLILLDITMPGMDGFEVSRQLKNNPATRSIPIIFISALDETEQKVRAFAAGGVDYVTKPFQLTEVEARVRTQLEMRRQRVALERSYEQLREMERLRDDLTHMIAHDMRTPLLGLQLAIELLAMPPTAGGEPPVDIMKHARSAVATLIEMVNQMLDVSRLESGKITPHRISADLVPLVAQSVESIRLLAGTRTLTVAPMTSALLETDAELIARVLANLLGNAVKFTLPNGTINVTLNETPAMWRVAVTDDGPGIAPENHRKIFEKFGQAHTQQQRKGTGLGLTFAKLAVESLGGTIGVRSAPGAGSTFWFELPKV